MTQVWRTVAGVSEYSEISVIDIADSQWHELAFIYDADTDAATNTGNGSIKTWLNGSQINNFAGLDQATLANISTIKHGLVDVSAGNINLIIDNLGIGALHPTASAPLIIRSAIDEEVSLTDRLDIQHINNIQLQAIKFNSGANAGIRVQDADGFTLVSSVVKSNTHLINVNNANIIIQYQII